MITNKSILQTKENVLHRIIIDPEGIYAVPAIGRPDLKWHLENGEIILDSPKKEFIKAYQKGGIS